MQYVFYAIWHYIVYVPYNEMAGDECTISGNEGLRKLPSWRISVGHHQMTIDNSMIGIIKFHMGSLRHVLTQRMVIA